MLVSTIGFFLLISIVCGFGVFLYLPITIIGLLLVNIFLLGSAWLGNKISNIIIKKLKKNKKKMKREFNKEAQSVLNKVLTDIHWQKIKQNKLIEEANELPSTISNLIGEYVQIGDKNYMLVGKAKQVFSDVVFLYGPGLSLYSYHGLDETGCLMEFRSIMVNPQCLDDVKIITREEFNTAVLSYVDKFLVDITENNWVKEHNKI